jgi:hypothetical protein
MDIAPSGCILTVFFPDGAMVIEILVDSSSFSASAPANYERWSRRLQKHVGISTNLLFTKISLFIIIEQQGALTGRCVLWTWWNIHEIDRRLPFPAAVEL